MSKGISTKELIIEKSSELFNIYGYHGCSLSEIMQATSLKKGGIYNHFRNKDEIALEAFTHNFNKVIERFRRQLDKASNAEEKLYATIEVFASFAYDPIVRGGGCPIFNTAVDATNTHPQLKQKAREGINTLKRYIEIKVEEGIAQGEFNKHVDSHQVSSLIICTLEGAIIMSRVNPDDRCISIAKDHLKNYIKEQLLSQEKRKKD